MTSLMVAGSCPKALGQSLVFACNCGENDLVVKTRCVQKCVMLGNGSALKVDPLCRENGLWRGAKMSMPSLMGGYRPPIRRYRAHWADHLVLLVVGLFVVGSSLNGNNGEWTNGDDMLTGGAARVASNKAAQKKARKNQLHAKVADGAHGRVEWGPRPEDLNYYRLLVEKDAKLDDPVGQVSIGKHSPERIVCCGPDGYAWDGRQVYFKQCNNWVAPDGTLASLVANVGEEVYARPGGLGWCWNPMADTDVLIEYGRQTIKFSSPFRRFNHPSFSYRGERVDAISGILFIPAIDDLNKEFPSAGRLDSARLKAATALLTKRYCPVGLPMSIVRSTIEHWAYGEHLTRQQLVDNTRTTRLLGLGCINEADSGFVRSLHNLNITERFGSFWKEFGADCKIPDEYEFKRTFSLKLRGAECDPVGKVYPRFNTQKMPDATARYSRTVWFDYMGNGANFVIYDVNANNACKALKRCVGARENEEMYMVNQASLLYKLCGSGWINEAVMATLKVSFPDCEFVPDKCAGTNIGPWIGGLPALMPLPNPSLLSGDYPKRVVAGHADVRAGSGSVLVGKADQMQVGSGGNSHLIDVNPAIHGPYTKGINYAMQELFSRVNRPYIESVTDQLGAGFCEHWKYYKGFQQYLEYMDTDVGRLSNAEITHIKKKLRQSYVTGVFLHVDEDNMVARLNGCVKKELAKYGKVPRLFVSYDAGCMYANELPELVKVGLNTPFFFPKGTLSSKFTASVYIMAKPKEDTLSQMFLQLINATMSVNHVCVVIYSDDSVYSGNIDGKPFGFNVDISSCDASNMSLVFAITGTLLSAFSEKRACGLISQCMLPLRVVNPDKVEEVITVCFHSAFEGSGTVLTTILNHVATYLNAVLFVMLLAEYDRNPKMAVMIGASYSGHLVTVDDWAPDGLPVFEKMQFLKHSPMQAECGTWVPTLNFGCIMRGLGSVEQDLEAKHLGLTRSEFDLLPIHDRMMRFVGSVVRSLVNEPGSAVLEALRGKFGSCGDTVTETRYGFDVARGKDTLTTPFDGEALRLSERNKYDIKLESVCRRYDLTPDDVSEFVEHIWQTQLGAVSTTRAAGCFYRLDYGVPTLDLPPL